jgi:hypothetical protein
MKARKYTDIRVLSSFYVNSLSQPFFTVVWGNRDHHHQRDYCPMFGWESLPKSWSGGWSQAPAYLTAEAEAAIIRLLQSDDARPYEYNRDGDARYENLRYWDDETKAEIIRICRPKGWTA